MDRFQLVRGSFRAFVLLVVASGLAGTPLWGADDTVEVKFESIALKVPKTWKQQPPANRLRLGQFEVPGPAADDGAAELSVFNFGASDVGANVRRWIESFAAEGRKAKTTSGKCSWGQYYLVDVRGTYNQPVGPPIQGQTRAMPSSRMLAVMLVVKDKGAYYLKLVGPEVTVTPAADAFRASFGGEEASESVYDPAS